MSIIERIYQISDFKGDSIYKISKEIDVSNGYFAKTRAKNGSVGGDIIEKIVSYYDDLNVEWLITGKGEMLKTKSKENVVKKNDHINDHINDHKPNVKKTWSFEEPPAAPKTIGKSQYTHEQLQAITEGKLRVPKPNEFLDKPLRALAVDSFEGVGSLEPIPLVTEVAAAGYFGGGFCIEKEDVMRYYIIPDFKRVDFMIRVVGSSMYPKYSPGDVIAVRVLHERNFIQWNKTHLFATREQGLIVKRPKKHPNPEYVTMVSDNKEYEPFDVRWDDIFGVAIIIGTIRAEG